MKNCIEKHWLCWSPRQNALRVESEAAGLQINQRAFRQGARLDYIPIGCYPSQDEAVAAADRLKPMLRERDQNEGSNPCPVAITGAGCHHPHSGAVSSGRVREIVLPTLVPMAAT